MAFAHNGGVRIYYEVEGAGAPLVMVHGFSANLGMWREMGYAENLADRFRLILVDPRGHGQSDKPHDPEQYRPELMVEDVVAVLDELEVEKACYLGASMGAAIGFEVARHSLERFSSLILIGYGRYGPLTEAQQRFQSFGLRMEEMAATMEPEAALAEIDRMLGRPHSPEDRARFLANDHKALLAFMRAYVQWPGFEEALPGVTVPALFVVAEGDPYYQGAKACADAMPDARFVTLSGVHGLGDYGGVQVVPHVSRFLGARG